MSADEDGERRPLLAAVPRILSVQYESVEPEHEVRVRLPALPTLPSLPALAEEEEEGSDESPGGEAGGPKTINSEEAAPASYICLGYIFSIIAGFCFTSW